MSNTELNEILDRYTYIKCEILKAQVLKAMVEAVDKAITIQGSSIKTGIDPVRWRSTSHDTEANKIGWSGSGQLKAGKLYDFGNSHTINVSDLQK